MEDFEYKGVKLRHVVPDVCRCAGCYFWDNYIPCTHEDVPECGLGIFVKVEENDSKRNDSSSQGFRRGES